MVNMNKKIMIVFSVMLLLGSFVVAEVVYSSSRNVETDNGKDNFKIEYNLTVGQENFYGDTHVWACLDFEEVDVSGWVCADEIEKKGLTEEQINNSLNTAYDILLNERNELIDTIPDNVGDGVTSEKIQININ